MFNYSLVKHRNICRKKRRYGNIKIGVMLVFPDHFERLIQNLVVNNN